MSRTRSIPALLIAISLAVAACGGSGEGQASGDEVYKLQFASYNVPDAAEALATKDWAERVSEATDGRVEIEFFFQEALLSAAETLPGVADGRADMGYVATGYYPAELPLTSVVGVPFISQDPVAQGKALADLYENNEALAEEWKSQGVHVLNWNPSSGNIVALKDAVTSLDDLKGIKVRGYGYVSEALKLAGMNPIGLAQPEVYEALQRGVIEATSGASMNIAIDRKFQEVAPHFVGMNFGSYSITADVISLTKWNSLPKDIRDAITSVSKEHPASYMEYLAEMEDESCGALLQADGDVTLLPESDTQAWRAAAGPKIRDIWANDVKKANPQADSNAFYDAYLASIQEYETGSTYVEPMQRCAARQ